MASDSNIEEIEAIRNMVDQSLPGGVRLTLRQAGISLQLTPSAGADLESVSFDQAFVDELAERELVEEMVSYRKNVTGIEHTIFISPKGHTRHGARIELALDPPHPVDPRGRTASISIVDAAVVAGDGVPPAVLDQVRRFIEINRDALLDYWEYRIDTDELRRRLTAI